MKKIFYFSPYLLPTSNAAAVRNSWLIRVLKESSHDVTAITNDDLYFKLPTNKHSALKRLFKEFLAGLNLIYLIVKIKKHDLYIFSSPPYITTLSASLFTKFIGKQYALDIRDIYPQVFFYLGLIKKESFAGKCLKWITSKVYLSARFITVATDGLRKIVLNDAQAINEKKVQVIFNGFDPKLFSPSEKKFKDFTIVFHGNLAKFQRTDLLVKTARSLNMSHPQIKFKVIGTGPGESELKVLPANTEYLGHMQYEEVGRYISKCHLGISLRTDDKISRDAFPVKAFEYIGVGIPVVIGPRGEASDFLEKHGLGKAVNSEVEDVKKGILFYYNSSKLESNKNFKAEAYSRENQSKKILSLIGKLNS